MNTRTIKKLSFLIIILTFLAALIGVLSFGSSQHIPFLTLRDEIVFLYGRGIYYYDTESVALQAIAQDFVTLIIALPLLVFATINLDKNKTKITLLHVGMIAYTLYAYGTYSFLSAYNRLFLIYVMIFSLSLFVLVISIIQIDQKKIANSFSKNTPIKSTSFFLIFIGLILFLMWMARIFPSIIENTPPFGLESYTTLVIQVFDLGLIVPLSVLAGILLLKKYDAGYLLASILLFKGLALFTAVAAMAIVQAFLDSSVNMVEVSIFLTLTTISFFFFYRFYRSIDVKENTQ